MLSQTSERRVVSTAEPLRTALAELESVGNFELQGCWQIYMFTDLRASMRMWLVQSGFAAAKIISRCVARPICG